MYNKKYMYNDQYTYNKQYMYSKQQRIYTNSIFIYPSFNMEAIQDTTS